MRRTTCTATVYDVEGYPFIVLRGNAQDVGDALAIYIHNISSPLGGHPPDESIELVESREEGE